MDPPAIAGLLALLALPACYTATYAVRVRDPHEVALGSDHPGDPRVILPAGGPAEQRPVPSGYAGLVARRGADGSITVGREVTVAADGRFVPIRDDTVAGRHIVDVRRLDTLVCDRRGSRGTCFHALWLTTSRHNVVSAERHTEPIRSTNVVGGVLVGFVSGALGTVLAASSHDHGQLALGLVLATAGVGCLISEVVWYALARAGTTDLLRAVPAR